MLARRDNPFIFRILWSGILVLLIAGRAYGAGLPAGLAGLLGPGDSLILAAPGGAVLLAARENTPRIPASTLKLLTALAALHHWSPDHRFPTEIYLDDQRNLTVKGYGDPLLISETIAMLVRNAADGFPLLSAGVRELRLDDTYFSQPIRIPGVGKSLNPYDAPNGALCANFNTINFNRDPQGNVVSAESQTPLVPLARKMASLSGLSRGRIKLGQGNQAATRYCGQLLHHFFTRGGVPISGKLRIAPLSPADSRCIWRQASPFPLTELVRRLMRYSNNFMANQLFLSLGADLAGPPATLDKGAATVAQYAQRRLGLENLVLVEGSGISRENRLSAADLLKILEAFKPYADLLPADPTERYKTGTLSGIRTRAGYILDIKERRYPYAILLNTPGKSPQPILEILKREVHKTTSLKIP